MGLQSPHSFHLHCSNSVQWRGIALVIPSERIANSQNCAVGSPCSFTTGNSDLFGSQCVVRISYFAVVAILVVSMLALITTIPLGVTLAYFPESRHSQNSGDETENPHLRQELGQNYTESVGTCATVTIPLVTSSLTWSVCFVADERTELRESTTIESVNRSIVSEVLLQP